MRDEIAEIIKKKTSRYDNAYWMCADSILALLKERVEKEKNPIPCDRQHTAQYEAWEDCRRTIMEVLQ